MVPLFFPGPLPVDAKQAFLEMNYLINYLIDLVDGEHFTCSGAQPLGKSHCCPELCIDVGTPLIKL